MKTPDSAKELYVDNTILSAVAECDTKTVVRYVWDLDRADRLDISPPLYAGQCAHEALAVWFQTDQNTDAALRAFQILYEGWPEEHGVEPGDRFSYANLYGILEHWFRTRAQDGLPFVPLTGEDGQVLAELSLQAPLYEDSVGRVIFTGLLDLPVQEARTGRYCIVDHKTTGNMWDIGQKYRMDAQLSGYQWLGNETLGKEYGIEFDGVGVNAVDFSKMPASGSKCREHGVQYAECGPAHQKSQILFPIMRPPAEIAEWKATAIELALRYRELLISYGGEVGKDLGWLRTQGKFSRACPWCPFMEWCGLQRPKRALTSARSFTEQEWRPQDERGLSGKVRLMLQEEFGLAI
jgi:hypothetical protein